MKEFAHPVCQYCKWPAELVLCDINSNSGIVKQLHRWECKPCEAHVLCHESHPQKMPKGTLAKKELRQLRFKCNEAINTLWYPDGPMKQKEAFAHAAALMDIPLNQFNVGYMDEDACKLLLELIKIG